MKSLLFILILILTLGLFGQDTKFNSINTNNGLSNNFVTAVIEDKYGFIWIATSEGLNRLDGYNFKIYKNQPKENKSISGNFILCLEEDKEGNLWIGTNQDGLSLYKQNEEAFYNYNYIEGDSTTIPGTVIRCIFIDSEEDIWIGTNDGLAKYNAKSDNFIRFYFSIENELHNTHVRSIIEVNEDELIVQNNMGVFLLNKSTGESYKIDHPMNSMGSHDFPTEPLLHDSEGNYWMGSNDGLIKHNSKTNKTILYKHNYNDPFSISSNKISKIFEDRNKNIWVGTENNGLNLFNKETDKFTTFTYNIHKKHTIANNIITNIYQDNNGILWVSTQEGGLSYINTTQNRFEHFTHNPFNNNSISNNKIGAIHEDEEGLIWIGTGNGGLNRLNTKTNQIKHLSIKTENISPSVLAIKNHPTNKNNLVVTGWGLGLFEINKQNLKLNNLFNTDQSPTLNIKGMGIDSDNNIWLATHHQNGMEVYNPKNKQFYNKFNAGIYKSNILGVPYSVSMLEDSKNRRWVVSYIGLYMFDSIYHSFITVRDDTNTISSNYVLTIFEDSKQNIWVGSSNGLDKIIEKNGNISFERLSGKYDIPLNIKNILEDDNGSLWLASNHEIVKFDPEIRIAKTILGIEDVENQEYFERSCLKTKTGEMYFGGTNGFIRFHPDTLLNLQSNPKLYLVDFQIFNKSQNINSPNSPLKNTILETKNIELNHLQSDLSFEFVAIDFNKVKDYEYAYILEGFDKNWNYVGKKKFATYTNIPPGDYTFIVKIADGQELSAYKDISVNIKIKPPYWKTKLAYVIYILLAILTLYLFRRSIINREKLKNELKLEKLTLKNVHETNLMKLRFFTNISHEFRTPLTLIKAPIDKILSNTDEPISEEQNTQMHLIKRNADKLLKMVNQLMDYRKLEAGSLILETSQGDIVEFCKNTWEVFNLLATQRKIKYEFNTNVAKQIMNFDSDKLDKILSNLITNAIKNTSELGSITVLVKLTTSNSLIAKKHSSCVEISVKDTGTGIPKKDLPHIFDRFFSATHKKTAKIEGTGIGLTLVKELTELHGGIINVVSVEGEGSEFIVTLPIIIENQETAEEKQVIKHEIIDQQINNKIEEVQQTDKKFKILVVEDDPDLRDFISKELLETYEVYTAKDGEDGLRKAFFNFPDIVISDVMMPNMNGFELCKSLKTDERTSHIPIILLTARQSEEKNIEGFEAGADDYIHKPFNLAVLKSRISNLLLFRTELIEKFNKDGNFEFKTEGIDEKDKKLIQSVIDLVLENIGEEKINAEFISSRVHISRSLLYIKIEAITGQSVNEFIRGIRLKKSLRLLKQNTMSITEIAYAVGFSSQPYFTRCFTKLYGFSPTEYINKNVNN